MNPDRHKPKVVAVIPCLNEEKFIGDIVTRASKYVDRVIVVDDGSSDKTVQKAVEAGAEVVSHPSSQGAGAATRTGLKEGLKSGADIIVTLDGDSQHDPDEIPELLKPFSQEEPGIVIGSRFMKQACVPPLRKMGIDIITWMYNAGHRKAITDAQSGYRAYSRKAAEAIKITYPGFGFSIQTLVQARKKKMKIIEVPVACIYHNDGSTLNPVVHGLSVALAALKVRIKEEFTRSR